MGRWSQFDGDSTRLPVGITRIAYDADTTRYMFQDTHGRRYIGAPGEEYGVMVPITAADALAPLGSKVSGKHTAKPAYDRPALFAGDAPAGSPLNSEFSSDDDDDVATKPPPPARRAHGHTRSPSAPSTFADILPPSLIAPAPPPPPPSSSHLPPSPFRAGKSRRAASTGDADAAPNPNATPARGEPEKERTWASRHPSMRLPSKAIGRTLTAVRRHREERVRKEEYRRLGAEGEKNGW
ncbi:hypothetical protein HETIRDRAFT_433390 [Heterobasidion irregulare TC 32-1]|uniref:Carbohydrate-binding module family 50 protein n=1 Tax=Heterobasidion irregulare (strain TC 32-1) TaxID=747525 RepID=W4KG00_HETIT|nr:uncharacterized protein HETIRDRAFT_433390 [Heterobasidion irregulare TC 32-1]ETW84654.1 hypothetical protein HETIRDRAFT_433390 [Heterobasidion irregulare TC 32-1]